MQSSINLQKQPLHSPMGRGIICPASLVRTVNLARWTMNRVWNDGSCCVRAVQFREAVSTEVCTKPPIIRGALAQLVARNVRIVEVRGSNPLCSTRLPLVRVVFFCEHRGFEGPGVNEAPVEPQSRSRPSPKARIESPMLHQFPLSRRLSGFFVSRGDLKGRGDAAG